MRNYIIRRLLVSIPTLFLVTLLVFFMIRLIPGSILDIMIVQTELVSPGDMGRVKEQLGLDVPIHIQYARWIWNIVAHGNFGNSLWTKLPVTDEILARVPVTLELGLFALIVAQLIALPIGIYSAIRQDTAGDYIGRSLAIFSIAVPGFWLATLAIVFPSIWWGYMPPLQYVSFTADPIANLRMFVLPAVLLGMSLSGSTMRMTRTMMLEVLRQDYVRTAWAKGLGESVVITRHALKNALIPVITVVGTDIPVLIGGTVIIEQIFVLPGMGRLIVDSTLHRDYTVVSGVLIFFAVAVVLTNLVVDLAYSYLDPRIRLGA